MTMAMGDRSVGDGGMPTATVHVTPYLEPERMRSVMVRCIDRWDNPMLLPGCADVSNAPVFREEPDVVLDRGAKIRHSLRAGLEATAKMAVRVAGADFATVDWSMFVNGIMGDAAHWVEQESLRGRSMLCLDTLWREWTVLVTKCGGPRRVLACQMRDLVRALPVVPLQKGEWWARWMTEERIRSGDRDWRVGEQAA